MTDVTAPPHARALVECWQKEQFDTPLKARKAALRINRAQHREVVSPYRCSLCGKHHIGGGKR